ncbi:CopG family transcriptional regulator [Desulfosporosinus sp. FKA]|uniref:ribbon-helix-helix domain-containing protein n=1 Tax=Desulfosporosinus sp. FKA TaxID=1969834 RepID=UPI000B4A07D9|nr:CopG family transcriptional regulator [Desulfosporosinus sp. FKA]
MKECMPSGFNMRRRRHIVLGTPNENPEMENHLHGISWPESPNQYDPTDDDMEVFENRTTGNTNNSGNIPEDCESKRISIRGRELSVGPLERPRSLSKEGQKITVYLNKDLVEAINSLKKAKFVPSISWLVTEALIYYLTEKGN